MCDLDDSPPFTCDRDDSPPFICDSDDSPWPPTDISVPIPPDPRVMPPPPPGCASVGAAAAIEAAAAMHNNTCGFMTLSPWLFMAIAQHEAAPCHPIKTGQLARGSGCSSAEANV